MDFLPVALDFSRPTFLVVGTVEPRKAHRQVVDAFDLLWQSGSDLNLVIVGKQGWMVDDLAERIRDHGEMGKRLFWLEEISDDALDRLYESSTCLLAPSYGEGFGLPLIEAAMKNLPILARDIPVFREVVGDHAAYFEANVPGDLASAIRTWLVEYQAGIYPRPNGIRFVSWQEAAVALAEKLLHHCGRLPEPSRRTCSAALANA